MRYAYRCSLCGKERDIIKPVASIDEPEFCDKCGGPSDRVIRFNGQIFGHDDWDKGEFNPGLGCYVRNKKHRESICKEKGLEEVGTESADKFHERQERKRQDLIKERYDAIEREITTVDS